MAVPTTYLLDEDGYVIKKWDGYDDEDPGQSKFVNYIKNSQYNIEPYSKARSGLYPKEAISKQSGSTKEKKSEGMTIQNVGSIQSKDSIASAEEKVTDFILPDGKKYSGWGYYHNGQFYPHGCGKKYYSDFYVYGNFNEGVLNGPAINSHDYYMYTMFFKENLGNGWGLCINSGELVEFGYYENSQLKTNLTHIVKWYYEGKLRKAERSSENMMSMWTSKETKEVTTLLIGYAPKKISDDMMAACMGFRFKADSSVWVGTGELNIMTGDYIHFRSDGCIDIGLFDKGKLIERIKLHDLIDQYFGVFRFDESDPFASLFENRGKSSYQLERESEREKYNGIEEPEVDFNYFTGKSLYSDDIPF